MFRKRNQIKEIKKTGARVFRCVYEFKHEFMTIEFFDGMTAEQCFKLRDPEIIGYIDPDTGVYVEF